MVTGLFNKKCYLILNPNKQAVEILFWKKREKDNYPPLALNGDNVRTAISQNHLGLV